MISTPRMMNASIKPPKKAGNSTNGKTQPRTGFQNSSAISPRMDFGQRQSLDLDQDVGIGSATNG